jgi:hypothetical protein
VYRSGQKFKHQSQWSAGTCLTLFLICTNNIPDGPDTKLVTKLVTNGTAFLARD